MAFIYNIFIILDEIHTINLPSISEQKDFNGYFAIVSGWGKIADSMFNKPFLELFIT